jgi:hypothetical protein
MARATMPRMQRPALVAAGATGLLAALAVLAVTGAGVALRPGSSAWIHLVLGSPYGSLEPGLVIRLPGLDRRSGDSVAIEADSGSTLAVAIDRGPLQPLRVPHGPALLPLPAGSASGLRLDLRAAPGEPPSRIAEVRLERRARPSALPPLLAGLAVVALVLPLSRRLGALGASGLGLLAGGLLGLAAAPAHLFLSLPDAPAVGRFFPALVLLAAAGVAWRRVPPAQRRDASRLAAVVAAVVFGAWIRGAFLPSPGSWDTEYWKAWTLRAASAGVTRTYGDPGAVPAGHFLAQARGQEELWKVRAFGRDFVVDYPPLALALWRWSFWEVTRAGAGLDGAEAQNAAVKLPSVLGDVAAMAVLLWAFPHRPWRGLALAALYWASPVSWFASAVLGYLDGAYAPLAAAAVVCAGRGRAGATGAWLALACLVKPTAVVVAPALAVALVARHAPLRRAVAAGFAVVLAALVPFALAGTLTTAVVHVYRILFQGTLSGGFANPWWVIGHVLKGAGLAGPVAYVRLEALGLDPRPIGTVLFGAVAVLVALRQHSRAGIGPAALAAGTLVFAYGMLAVGVHDNHPYPMLLLFMLTGLATPRLRWLAVSLSATLVVNSLALSGLGRLGARHEILEPLARDVGGLRMALGFDLTLALAALHALLFLGLLWSLRDEMRVVAEAEAEGAAAAA